MRRDDDDDACAPLASSPSQLSPSSKSPLLPMGNVDTSCATKNASSPCVFVLVSLAAGTPSSAFPRKMPSPLWRLGIPGTSFMPPKSLRSSSSNSSSSSSSSRALFVCDPRKKRSLDFIADGFDAERLAGCRGVVSMSSASSLSPNACLIEVGVVVAFCTCAA